MVSTEDKLARAQCLVIKRCTNGDILASNGTLEGTNERFQWFDEGIILGKLNMNINIALNVFKFMHIKPI